MRDVAAITPIGPRAAASSEAGGPAEGLAADEHLLSALGLWLADVAAEAAFAGRAPETGSTLGDMAPDHGPAHGVGAR